ncbi:MAG: hypothetical protein ACOC2W_03040 [bacterium]
MKIELKENVIYESFDDRNKMMQKIFNMILESKTDKIIYKGIPNDINYKMMKKVLLKDYTKKIEPDKVRDMFSDVVKSTDNRNFCIIYKEK